MRRITEEVTDLVLEFGGSLRGEHGDGLVRSEWNRKMFGPVRLRGVPPGQARRSTRTTCSTPARSWTRPAMTENLRYPPGYRPAEPPTVFDYSQAGGLLPLDRAVQRQRASAARRRAGRCARRTGRRCDERDSTRGRANALRLALAEPGAPTRRRAARLRERWVHEVIDLCLMCKACKAECPSNVDVAKLKAEFLQFYYRGRPRPLGHLLDGRTCRASTASARRWRRWSTGCRTAARVRWLLEKRPASTAAAACRRCTATTSAAGSRRHRPDAERRQRAARCCCWTTASRRTTSRRSAGRRCACWSGPATRSSWPACLLRPGADQQGLPAPRPATWPQAQVPALAQRVADGTPILGLEPSCILTLADEWPELVPGAATRGGRRGGGAGRRLAGRAGRRRAGASCRWSRGEAKCVLHGHCHQKALLGVGGAARRRCGWCRGWTCRCSTPAAAAWRGRSATRGSTTT